jgi:DNA-binding NtrC family response regulator
MAGYRESKFESDMGISQLRLEDLERTARSTDGSPALPLRDWIALAESWRIARALREARGNRSAAARALGIGRRTLYAKMDKLGLVPSWGVAREERPSAARLSSVP